MARVLFNALILLAYLRPLDGLGAELAAYQQKLRDAGNDMLENLEVSYVYGGSKVGDAKTCDECNQCLEQKRPAPKERFKVCSLCGNCSLDCSHFVQLVFSKAGLTFPYITSTQMLELPAATLEKKYQLRPVATTIGKIIDGDMLVYRGHVVIVESVRDRDSADIIHATGGKDIREPGQGIQRERFARMSMFRGELLRVLRHARLDDLLIAGDIEMKKHRGSARVFKMRPVEKKNAD